MDMLGLIDTHTHLFVEEFDEDRELALIRAGEAGVTRLFMPNIDDESVERMLALCDAHEGCYPMIGGCRLGSPVEAGRGVVSFG